MAQVRMHTPPAREIKRKSPRWDRQRPITRGGVSDHEGGGGGTPATGATAGIPGTWTPPGSTAPSNLAGTTGIVATPATAWTTGQHVLLSQGGSCYWNATAWTLGVAP